ncbi:MAG: hypothetical protein HYS08_05115 [Chlamydiae bacterium]|nr:hypothetical protein [Chlamydiota bacterium]
MSIQMELFNEEGDLTQERPWHKLPEKSRKLCEQKFAELIAKILENKTKGKNQNEQ